MSRLRTPVRIARAVGDQVIVDPVRTGRLRRVDWPPGLSVIMVVAGLTCLVALLLALASGPLRSSLDLTGSWAVATLPDPLLPLLYLLPVIVAALMITGALHAPLPIRFAGMGYGLVLAMISASHEQSAGFASPVVIMAGLGWLALLGFQLARLRGRFGWWEYPVVLVLLAVIVIGPAALQHQSGLIFGIDNRPVYLMIILLTFAAVSLPIVALAGVALSEVALATALWAVDGIAPHVRQLGGRILAGALALIALGCTGYDLATNQVPAVELLAGWLVTILIMVAAVAIWWLVVPPGPDAVGPSSPFRSLPEHRGPLLVLSVALVLPTSVAALLQPVVLFVSGPGLSALPDFAPFRAIELLDLLLGEGGNPIRALAALALVLVVVLITAVRTRAGGGSRWPLQVALTVAVLTLASTGWQLDWWPVAWSEQAAGGLLTLLAIGFGVGWAITGRLTRARVEALAVTLLIAIAVGRRELIGDPMALLLGLAGGAALIFGILWNLLTGAEYANGDSARFPQPARTMLIIGNVAFGVVALAYNALTRSESGIELDHYVQLGSRLVGTGLLLGAAFLALGSVLRRPDPAGS